MDELFRCILLLLASGLLLIICSAYTKGYKKFNKYVSALDKKEFFFQKSFIIGLILREKFKIQNNYFLDRNSEKIAFLYGDRYYQFYYAILSAAQITYILLAFEIGFLLAAISNEISLLFLSIFLGIFLYFYYVYEVSNKYNRQVESIRGDFPKVLSKLQIYLTTGMPLREAWRKVALSGNSKIYEEMKKIEIYINNGFTEVEALNKFSNSCKIAEVKKFSLLLTQNIEKGNKDINSMINALASESWNDKKHAIMKKAQIASSKLVFPLVIILISIMIMVMIPVFSGF